MDWREFMRGFFGGRTPPLSDAGVRGEEWPPPPPIAEFRRDENEDPSDKDSNQCHGGQSFFWGGRSRRPNQEGREEDGLDNFGRSFVFGDLFSALGEAFQEMHQTMREMDSFFGSRQYNDYNMDIDDHSRLIPFVGQTPNASVPPARQDPDQSNSQSFKDDNIRNFVLKDPDTATAKGSTDETHYIPAATKPSDKVDRNLDDMYQNSQLDMSNIPIPNTNTGPGATPAPPRDSPQNKSLTPFNFGQRGEGSASSFQRTYQTFAFKNGRWEGEIVKENQDGKEITKYYQDKNGQRHETTEYIPNSGSSTSHTRIIEPSDISPDGPLSPPSSVYQPSQLFQLFDRIFKPRM